MLYGSLRAKDAYATAVKSAAFGTVIAVYDKTKISTAGFRKCRK